MIQMQHVRIMQARILVLVRADTVEMEKHVVVRGDNINLSYTEFEMESSLKLKIGFLLV